MEGGKGNPKQPSRKRPRKERAREHTALTRASLAGYFLHDNEQKKGEAQRASRKPSGRRLQSLKFLKASGVWAGVERTRAWIALRGPTAPVGGEALRAIAAAERSLRCVPWGGGECACRVQSLEGFSVPESRGNTHITYCKTDVAQNLKKPGICREKVKRGPKFPASSPKISLRIGLSAPSTPEILRSFVYIEHSL